MGKLFFLLLVAVGVYWFYNQQHSFAHRLESAVAKLPSDNAQMGDTAFTDLATLAHSDYQQFQEYFPDLLATHPSFRSTIQHKTKGAALLAEIGWAQPWTARLGLAGVALPLDSQFSDYLAPQWQNQIEQIVLEYGLDKQQNTNKAIDVLIKYLEHKDSQVQFVAAWALARLAPASVLNKLLDHQDPQIMVIGLLGLQRHPSPARQYLQRIQELLRFPNSEVQLAAAQTMRLIGGSQTMVLTDNLMSEPAQWTPAAAQGTAVADDLQILLNYLKTDQAADLQRAKFLLLQKSAEQRLTLLSELLRPQHAQVHRQTLALNLDLKLWLPDETAMAKFTQHEDVKLREEFARQVKVYIAQHAPFQKVRDFVLQIYTDRNPKIRAALLAELRQSYLWLEKSMVQDVAQWLYDQDPTVLVETMRILKLEFTKGYRNAAVEQRMLELTKHSDPLVAFTADQCAWDSLPLPGQKAGKVRDFKVY